MSDIAGIDVGQATCIYPLSCYNNDVSLFVTVQGVHMSDKSRKPKRRSVKYEWNGSQIRALRQHMQRTQREMADELQVRQQTISEWETGTHHPHRSMQKVLTMIAESAGFAYEVNPAPAEDTPTTTENDT